MDPNEKLTGLASLGPSGGGQPPMPPMGGGQPPMPPMGGGQPPMPPMGGPGMGEMAMEGQPPMEEPGMDLEQDSAMLAEAVVGRAQGDIGAAIAVLDNAKAMLMSAAESGGQEPQMMMHGGEVHYKKGGGPLYAESGRSLSATDLLRQMIMDDLAQMAAAANTQQGRTISDEDLELYKNLLNQGQEGRSLSDADLKMIPSLFSNMTGENIPASFYENMPPLMRKGGGELNPGLQALQKSNPEVVKKILGKANGGSMSDKDSLMLSDAEKFSNLLKSMR